MPNKECRPVFIVGSSRTGTSVVVNALLDGAEIPGHREGHYIPIVHFLAKAAQEYHQQQTGRDKAKYSFITKIPLKTVIQDVLDMVKGRYEKEFAGKEVWFDKSPDGPTLRALPYILTMWPNARFIFTKRRSIENIVSRLKKFLHLSFRDNCERWALSMRLWKEHRPTMSNDSWIEIDQRDIAIAPAEVAKKIGTLLELDEPKIKKIENIFSTQRPEFSGSDEAKPLSLETVGWSAQQKEVFKEVCGAINREWGYSEDERYYL